MRQLFTKKFNRKKFSKAFSLIELSIIIAVLSVVIVGVLSVTTSKTINSKSKSSSDNIAIIYQALGRYLQNTGSLPCPAPITDIKNTSTAYGSPSNATDCSDAGIYKSTTSNLIYGMVPIQALGLSSSVAEDAYGNKIVYVVDRRLATTSSDSFENSIIEAADGGTVTYQHITISGTSETNAMFVLMSRGANQSGAYSANSASPSTSVSNESSNDLSSVNDGVSPATSTFDSTFLGSAAASDFDDVVFYKTRNQMFDDFGAWTLVPCAAQTQNKYCGELGHTTDGTEVVWPKSYHDQTVISPTACPLYWRDSVSHPTRKCSLKGIWETPTECTYDNTPGSSTCFVGYCQKSCSYGGSDGHAHDSGYAARSEYLASGTTISNLRCNPGSGHAIGSSRSFTNPSTADGQVDLCHPRVDGVQPFNTTDRIATAPSVYCDNGTWKNHVSGTAGLIDNPCSPCRDCSSSVSGAETYVVYDYSDDNNGSSTNICKGKFRNENSSGWSGNYDCYYINGIASDCTSYSFSEHALSMTSLSHGSALDNCQYQGHNDNSSSVIWSKCVDGRFNIKMACSDEADLGNGHDNSWGSACDATSSVNAHQTSVSPAYQLSFLTDLDTDDASTCAALSCTKSQYYTTANAYDPSYSAGASVDGATINLRCNSGFGHSYIGAASDFSRTYTSGEVDICNVEIDGTNKFTTTDRISAAPYVTCSNGTWVISNACTSCKGCTSLTGAKSTIVATSTSTPSGANYCFGKYRTSAGINDFDCYGLTGSNCQNSGGSAPTAQHLLTPAGSQHLIEERRCQYQAHHDDSSANFTFKCVDGRYYAKLYCRDDVNAGNGYNGSWGASCSNNQQNFGSILNPY